MTLLLNCRLDWLLVRMPYSDTIYGVVKDRKSSDRCGVYRLSASEEVTVLKGALRKADTLDHYEVSRYT